MSIYDSLEKSLLEAIELEKNQYPLLERPNMPAPTFYAANREKELIDQLTSIRKKQDISQIQLADLTGNTQQAISRLEKKKNSPSLKLFCTLLYSLGYDLQIVPKQNQACTD